LDRAGWGDSLAAVNATLNGLSGLCLLVGRRAVKRKHLVAHRRSMLAAFGVSALFLVCYLTRVALMGTHAYPGHGVMKAVYLTLLGSHMLLAAAVPPLALRALHLAIKGRFEAHRAVVRYALPIWLYVSVTGVLVYLLLYFPLAR
jgi:putative membrane protein